MPLETATTVATKLRFPLVTAASAFALWLGATSPATNNASANDGPGFFADADSTGNVLSRNKSTTNDTFGMEDASAGAGTSGTGNTYSGNLCTGNGTAKSSPPGLC